MIWCAGACVCTCMCVMCMRVVCVCLCAHVHKCGGQLVNLRYYSLRAVHLVFLKQGSHWFGAYQIGWIGWPRDLPVSIFPVLGPSLSLNVSFGDDRKVFMLA